MNRPFLLPLLCITALAAPIGAVTPARAAGGDVATAQVLFDEARRRMAQHDYAGACPKLEESQRLSPAAGTEYNLADCWEHVGRLASAWAAFLDVADVTHRRGEVDREHAARDRATSLEPRLARVTIDVPRPRRVAGLEVQRDGQAVRDALWGVGVPVDAGEHRVEARAPGRKPWTSTVRATDGQTATVAIPDLPEAPAAPQPEPPAPVGSHAEPVPMPPPDPPTPNLRTTYDRTASLVVLGGAVVFAGVGALGLLERYSTIQSYNNSSCPPIGDTTRSVQCDGMVNAANTWQAVGIGGVVAGSLALVGGVVLWFLSPRTTAVAAACAPGPGWVGCTGTF